MFSRVIALCIIAVSAGGTVEKPREENPAYYTSDTSGIYNDGKHAGQILMSSAISDDSNSYANYYTYPTQDLLEEYSKYLHMKYNDEDDPRKNKAPNENKSSLDRSFEVPYYDYYNNKDLMQILQKVDEDSVGVGNVDNVDNVDNNIRRADTEEDVIIVNAITLTTTTESNLKYKKHKKSKSEQNGDDQDKKHKYKPRYNRKHKNHHHEHKTKQVGEKKIDSEAKIARNKYLKEQSKHIYHRKHYHHKHKGNDKKKDTKPASNETDSNESLEKQESAEHLIQNRAPKEESGEVSTTTKRVYKSLRGDKHFATSDLSRGVRINSEESQEDTTPKVQKVQQKKKKRPVKFEDQFQIVRHHHMYHDEIDEHDDHHDDHHDHDDDDGDDDELDEEDVHFIQKYYKDILKNNTQEYDKHKHEHKHEDEHEHHHDSIHIHEHEHKHEHEKEQNHKHKYQDTLNFPENSHKIEDYGQNSIGDGHEIEDHEDLHHHLAYSNYLTQLEENREPKKSSLQEIKDVLYQSGFKQVNVPVSEVIINHHHENIDHPEAYQYQLYQRLPENFKEEYANTYDSYQERDPLASLYQPPLGNEFFVSGEGSNPYENFLQDDNAENCDETSSSSPSTSYVENVQPYAQNYNFKYGVDDPKTGDMKTHYETRDGDVVVGEYKFTEADGKVRVVKYKVDKEDGFKAVVLREENGAPETKK